MSHSAVIAPLVYKKISIINKCSDLIKQITELKHLLLKCLPTDNISKNYINILSGNIDNEINNILNLDFRTDKR